MNRKLYWKQKLPILFLNFFCMIGLAIFLSVTANSFDSIFLILLIWIVILTVHLVISYYTRKVQMEKLLNLAEQLEERYLLSEVMEKPGRADDRVYYQLLKSAGKSMLEQVAEVRRERTQYKEYVELQPVAPSVATQDKKGGGGKAAKDSGSRPCGLDSSQLLGLIAV